VKIVSFEYQLAFTNAAYNDNFEYTVERQNSWISICVKHNKIQAILARSERVKKYGKPVFHYAGTTLTKVSGYSVNLAHKKVNAHSPEECKVFISKVFMVYQLTRTNITKSYNY